MTHLFIINDSHSINMFLRFSSNSEAFASDLLENIMIYHLLPSLKAYNATVHMK